MAAQRPVDGGRHGACTSIRTNAPTHSVHTKAGPLQGAELAELEGAVWPAAQQSRAACRRLWGAESLRIATAADDGWLGLEQLANGPCAVLAAVQARLVAAQLARLGPCEADPLSLLVDALAGCLEDAAVAAGSGMEGAPHPLCRLVLPCPRGTVTIAAAGAALRAALRRHVAVFTKPGGLIALLHSLVATRGVERVRQELKEAGEPSLVAGDTNASDIGQVGFCTESLLTLCTSGAADAALDPSPTPARQPTVGVAAEQGLGDFVVGTWLRSPARRVWVLRWGAHYSTVWRHRSRLWHYNGAAGRFASVSVEETCDEADPPTPEPEPEPPSAAAAASPPAPATGRVLEWIQRRPGVGSLTADTQVHVLWAEPPAGDSPADSSSDGPKWYCAPCYRQGRVGAPNWNDPGTTVCGACGEDRTKAVDRSAWVKLAALCAADQAQARRQWASSWEKVLWACAGPRWRVTQTHGAIEL